jgi:hypothetical protein
VWAKVVEEGGVGLGPNQREKGRGKREEKERGKCPLSCFSPWKRERRKERERDR